MLVVRNVPIMFCVTPWRPCNGLFSIFVFNSASNSFFVNKLVVPKKRLLGLRFQLNLKLFSAALLAAGSIIK